jgi:hypothetical protein
MPTERYSRNEAFLGSEGQDKIALTRTAIVGLGGLGSHIAQQLAYLGVRAFDLIDFDIVTDSSMNRLVGAADSDVTEQTKKIAVTEKMIRGINPKANVLQINARVDEPQSEAAIGRADVVFGCLDRDLPRLKLTQLCTRYAKPLFDLASDTGGEGNGYWYGGRLFFANGSGCLVCHDLLEQSEMRRDSMSPEQREAHDRIYGVKRDALEGTGPMVVSINGTVASIAVTEFMAFVSGLREPFKNLTYRGDTQTIRRSLDEPEEGCYYCTALWGTAIAP